MPARLSSIRSRTRNVSGRDHPPVTISVGVACFPADGDSPDTLVSYADEALYRAKRAGRNRVEMATGGVAI
ncbi:diguanylate cyclase [Roseateles asaccharophilus]|uniref:GGDEF domain-containing protein n=1 Tax=Roseateles asaccharophilus TaxID=582607 RepID=UPI00286BBA33|nr:diguanylate cyclase [Roseateles asaccharophilus]